MTTIETSRAAPHPRIAIWSSDMTNLLLDPSPGPHSRVGSNRAQPLPDASGPAVSSSPPGHPLQAPLSGATPFARRFRVVSVVPIGERRQAVRVGQKAGFEEESHLPREASSFVQFDDAVWSSARQPCRRRADARSSPASQNWHDATAPPFSRRFARSLQRFHPAQGAAPGGRICHRFDGRGRQI